MRIHRYPILLLPFLLLMTGCFRTSSTDAIQQQDSNRPYISESKSSTKNFNIHNLEDLYQFLTYDDNRYPLISAHRGGDYDGYPENAIETFAHWAERFPLIIECDVRITKDSVLVLMHDATLERTTDGKGKVSSKTWEELKALRLKAPNGLLTPYKIPTLEEVLRWGKDKVLFTLDVKPEVPYSLLTQIIQKTNAQPYSIVITYTANQARAINRINPDLMLSVNIQSQQDLSRLIEAGIPDNRMVAFVGTRQADQKLINLLHAHGIKTILGTMGNLDRQAKARGYQVYAEYVENGADILSTDNVEDAQKALDFYIKKRNLSSPYIIK